MVELALVILPKVTVGASHLVNWITSLRAAAMQSGEWTPELNNQWRAALLQQGIAPEETPDSAL
jgi:hypothetical protein